MNLGVKRIPHLANVSGELNRRAAVAHFDSMEPLPGEPVGNRLNIGVRRPKLGAKLLRR